MASATGTAGSFTDSSEATTTKAKECPIHPEAKGGACEDCMTDLKTELASTNGLLNQAREHEDRTHKDLLVASQKLARFRRETRQSYRELDDRLVNIMSEAEEAHNQVSAKMDEVIQKIADFKFCITEQIPHYTPRQATPQQGGAASTARHASASSRQREAAPRSESVPTPSTSGRGRASAPSTSRQEGAVPRSENAPTPSTTGRGRARPHRVPPRPGQAEAVTAPPAAEPPIICVPHEIFGRSSTQCTDVQCSMRGPLAPPKRTCTEPEAPARLTKRINVDARPLPVPPHSVVMLGGDESWSTETTSEGAAGADEDDDIIIESVKYVGEDNNPVG